jgi:hypothetical protein
MIASRELSSIARECEVRGETDLPSTAKERKERERKERDETDRE